MDIPHRTQIVYSDIVLTESSQRNEDQPESTFSIPEICIYEYEKWLILVSSHSASILMVCLDFPLLHALIPLILADTFKILNNLVKILKFKNSLRSVRQRELIEDSGSLLTEVIFIIFYNYNKSIEHNKQGIYYIYSAIPLAAGIFFGFLVKSTCHNKCQLFSDIIYYLFKLIKLAAVFAVAVVAESKQMSFDDKTLQKLTVYLMPMWICLIVFAVVIFLHLLSAINFFCRKSFKKNQIIGAFFLLFSLVLIYTSFLVFLYFLIVQKCRDMLYFPLMALSLFSLISIIFKRKLINAIFQYLDEFNYAIFDQHPIFISRENSNIVRVITVFTRKFFMKISNSYYSETEYEACAHHRNLSSEKKKTQNHLRTTSLSPKENLKKLELKDGNFTLQFCTICFEKYANSLLMNCGHGGLCFECAKSLQKSSNSCHICRGEIKKVLKTLPHESGLIEVVLECEEIKSSN